MCVCVCACVCVIFSTIIMRAKAKHGCVFFNSCRNIIRNV